jgi:hypothetical protein
MPLPIQFVLFMLVGWFSQQQQDVIEYLKAENGALREQLGGKRLRALAAAGRFALCAQSEAPPHYQYVSVQGRCCNYAAARSVDSGTARVTSGFDRAVLRTHVLA